MNDEANFGRDVDATARIQSRADFIGFVSWLTRDFEENRSAWENVTIENFLRGLASYLANAQGFYDTHDLKVDAELPSWRLFADALHAATVYD
jgi:hypothetical protein